MQEGPPSQSHKPYEDDVNSTEWERELRDEPLQDPLMYPGIYAPSGFDMLGILVRLVHFNVVPLLLYLAADRLALRYVFVLVQTPSLK